MKLRDSTPTHTASYVIVGVVLQFPPSLSQHIGHAPVLECCHVLFSIPTYPSNPIIRYLIFENHSTEEDAHGHVGLGFLGPSFPVQLMTFQSSVFLNPTTTPGDAPIVFDKKFFFWFGHPFQLIAFRDANLKPRDHANHADTHGRVGTSLSTPPRRPSYQNAKLLVSHQPTTQHQHIAAFSCCFNTPTPHLHHRECADLVFSESPQHPDRQTSPLGIAAVVLPSTFLHLPPPPLRDPDFPKLFHHSNPSTPTTPNAPIVNRDYVSVRTIVLKKGVFRFLVHTHTHTCVANCF